MSYAKLKIFIIGNQIHAHEQQKVDTQTIWKCKFQQDEKPTYLRHEPAGLVILVQGFIAKKMVVYRLAHRELRVKVRAALQRL